MIPLKDGLPDKETVLPEVPGVGAEPGVAGAEVTEAGEAGGIGGLGRVIWRVFAENKLALVSVGVIVFMLLFCFVGTSLLRHPAGQFRRDEHWAGPRPPELAASAGDRSQRLRHGGQAHGGWCHCARDRVAGRRYRHHLRCVLRGSLRLRRRGGGRGHDAYRRHGSFRADFVPPYRHRGDSSHFLLVDRVHRGPRRLAGTGASHPR